MAFKFNVDLNVLNHLGLGLYSNTPSVLTEIISNAWDADATCVDITLNIDTLRDQSIIIIDDGHGMNEQDILSKFLNVGYARRSDHREQSDTMSRQVMGRKGIGKLAMFSLANKIEIHTKTIDSNGIAFAIDILDLKDKISKNEVYDADDIDYDGNGIIGKGTKIILKDLSKNINKTAKYLKTQIARRFSVIGDSHNFKVKVNGQLVSLADRDYFSKLEFIWEIDEDPQRIAVCDKNIKRGVLENHIKYKDDELPIKGFIGSVVTPSQLKTDDHSSNNVITIIANGRIFQENILTEIDTAKVFKSYLVGEIQADFLDANDSADMATSSRQQLNENDARFALLKNFIIRQLERIDEEWTEWRILKGTEDAKQQNPVLKEWIDSLPNIHEKEAALKLIGKINTFRFSGSRRESEKTKKEVLKNTIIAFEKARIRNNIELMSSLSLDSIAFDNVFHSVDDIEASYYYDITEQRLSVISKFQDIVEDEELEKTVQKYLFDHLWLLDHSWTRIVGTTEMEKTVTKELKQIDPDAEKGARIDITFATVSGRYIIIEMKRPGVILKLEDLVAQGYKYRQAITQYFKNHPQTCSNAPIFDMYFLLSKNEFKGNYNDPEYVKNQLRSINAKIFTYGDLIAQSKNAYADYLQQQEKVSNLRKIIDSIN